MLLRMGDFFSTILSLFLKNLVALHLCTKHAPTENTAKVADVVMASTSEKSNNAAN